MIAKLTGALDSVGDDFAVVDVGGVGYLVFCSGRTLHRLGSPAGQTVSLRVETQVREDAINLYGFHDEVERDWFRLLTTVQGVGAKVALAILSVLDGDQLIRALATEDKAALTRADGVGPKLANRLISELKDKVKDLAFAPSAGGAAAADGTLPGGLKGGPVGDAVSALVNLGYKRAEAFGAVTAVAQRLGGEPAVTELIRLGLKELSQ